MSAKKKILVVGGAGYIGAHVVCELLDQGYGVTVFDNLSSGRRENLQPQAGFVHGDLADRPSLERALKGGFDALIHLAASKAAGESMTDPDKYTRNNLRGTLQLLEAATEAGVKTWVFSSTAAVYGSPQYLPMDEAHPTEPENYYGFTKLEIERTLHWYDKLKGVKSGILRYFNAAGYDRQGRVPGLEMNPANLLPVVMEAALGWRPAVQVFGTDYPTRDGSGLRDYIHVSDLARAHVAALNRLFVTPDSFTVNLGSEQGATVLEVIESSRRLSGRPIEAQITGRRPGDPAAITASSARARQLLNWQAQESDLESLIASTWQNYIRSTKGQ